MDIEAGGDLIYRWVDARAASSYMRHDAMIGRTRHWIPKDLSGLDKIYRKRGLSFAMASNTWMDVFRPIGFVLRRSALDNHVVDIDGHEIYLFSDAMDLHRSGIPCGQDLYDMRLRAIEQSLAQPDEAFVIGDIRNLAGRTARVLVRDEASEQLMKPWCDRHGIVVSRQFSH